jgi:hypothetical protein
MNFHYVGALNRGLCAIAERAARAHLPGPKL